MNLVKNIGKVILGLAAAGACLFGASAAVGYTGSKIEEMIGGEETTDSTQSRAVGE